MGPPSGGMNIVGMTGLMNDSSVGGGMIGSMNRHGGDNNNNINNNAMQGGMGPY
jgi:hypothetical protein